MKKIAIFLVLILLLGNSFALAACPMTGCKAFCDWIDEKASSDSYTQKMPGMMLKGVKEIVKAPVEILYHPFAELYNDHQYGLGLIRGLGIGTSNAIDELVYGVANIVSSVVPSVKPFESGHSCCVAKTESAL